MYPDIGEIYHINFNPAPAHIESRLIQRKDDAEDTVRSRLNAYHEQTKPLSEWYGIFSDKTTMSIITVDGSGTIEQVAKAIESELGGL